MDLSTLHEFEAEIRKTIPTFRVAFKNESRLQRVLGWLVRPFNPGYLTKYVTTFGATAWFASREEYEQHPGRTFGVLAHEFVHLTDGKKHPGWFRLSYMMPQALGPVALLAFEAVAGKASFWLPLLPLCAYIVGATFSAVFWVLVPLALALALLLAVIKTGWASLLLLAALVLLSPLPAPWRVKWEMRGYMMYLAIYAWVFGPKTAKALIPVYAKEFTGSSYYFMSWEGADIITRLSTGIDAAADGSLAQEEPYATVRAFLVSRGAIKSKPDAE